jgi:arsenite methyltransferase
MAEILDSVRSKYGAVAESTLSSNDAGVKAVAEAFGYSAEELTSIPAEANMGLSCGNPTATAHLRRGEVVVDLGSGGGLDVFLAARMVGPEGRAIGIDMTPAMIERARTSAVSGGYANVEFHQSTIDSIPLPDAFVDCVISNCVLNLAPDKAAVFREIARVLKPGGRLAVSDIALKGEVPEAIARSMAAYVGCIAGAIRIDDYRAGLLAAGFEHVDIVDSGSDLNAYAKVENQSGCCSPAMAEGSCCSPAQDAGSDTLHVELSDLLSKYDVNAVAASVKVYAIKPRSGATDETAAPWAAAHNRDIMLKVIFACVHNAGRSQMAAAFFNQLADPQKAHALSAGTEPGERVHPEVQAVMREVGVDLSHATPQKLTEELAKDAQLLITMSCGDKCPYVPGLRRDDWPLRDEVKSRVQDLLRRESLSLS